MRAIESQAKRQRILTASVFYIGAILIAIVMFLPFYWSVMTSFKPDEDMFSMPIKWFPTDITLEHYKKAFTTVPFGLFSGIHSFWPLPACCSTCSSVRSAATLLPS